MMRGVSHYKYSSGVRNVQHVITVPAPVPQQVIYIYANIQYMQSTCVISKGSGLAVEASVNITVEFECSELLNVFGS